MTRLSSALSITVVSLMVGVLPTATATPPEWPFCDSSVMDIHMELWRDGGEDDDEDFAVDHVGTLWVNRCDIDNDEFHWGHINSDLPSAPSVTIDSWHTLAARGKSHPAGRERRF
jgi:hypothetical protein